jgi:hypothetical protein
MPLSQLVFTSQIQEEDERGNYTPDPESLWCPWRRGWISSIMTKKTTRFLYLAKLEMDKTRTRREE